MHELCICIYMLDFVHGHLQAIFLEELKIYIMYYNYILSLYCFTLYSVSLY